MHWLLGEKPASVLGIGASSICCDREFTASSNGSKWVICEGSPAAKQVTYLVINDPNDDYDQTDGAALALYGLADIESKLEGNRVENVRKAVGHYNRLLRDYPESYLAAPARQAVNRLQSGP